MNNFKNRHQQRAGSELGWSTQPFVVTAQPKSYKFSIYLKSALEQPEEMVDVINALSNATEDDIVEIHINSGGGSLTSLDSLIFAMMRCPAHIHAIGSGIIASAATFPLLHADSFELSPNTQLLFHSMSFGDWGKSQDVLEYVNFAHDHGDKLMRETYRHLFSEEELDDIIKNKRERWLTSDEFMARFNKRNELIQKESEESESEADRLFDEMFAPPPPEMLKKLTKQQLLDLISGEVGLDENGEIFEIGKEDE